MIVVELPDATMTPMAPAVTIVRVPIEMVVEAVVLSVVTTATSSGVVWSTPGTAMSPHDVMTLVWGTVRFPVSEPVA